MDRIRLECSWDKGDEHLSLSIYILRFLSVRIGFIMPKILIFCLINHKRMKIPGKYGVGRDVIWFFGSRDDRSRLLYAGHRCTQLLMHIHEAAGSLGKYPR